MPGLTGAATKKTTVRARADLFILSPLPLIRL